jgi:copper(I)-binding protein
MRRPIMNRKQLMPYLILSFLALTVLPGCSKGNPQISITEAKCVPSRMLIGRASSFMKIVNNGNGSDSLRGCSIKEYPSVRGEIHNSVEGKMIKMEKIEVPAEHTVELKRGGFHLMFFGVPEHMGKEVTLVLAFQESGPVEVTVPVEMTAGHEMNH